MALTYNRSRSLPEFSNVGTTIFWIHRITGPDAWKVIVGIISIAIGARAMHPSVLLNDMIHLAALMN